MFRQGWRYFDDQPQRTDETCTYHNGSYTGDWQAHKRHGQGLRLYTSGGGYKGGWVNGKRHGYGFRRYADGGWFEGGWVKGKRHGPGLRMYPNGRYVTGRWWGGVPPPLPPLSGEFTLPLRAESSEFTLPLRAESSVFTLPLSAFTPYGGQGGCNPHGAGGVYPPPVFS